MAAPVPKIMDTPSYSPNLVPYDFQMFEPMKDGLQDNIFLTIMPSLQL
jgi:hypothetical protein